VSHLENNHEEWKEVRSRIDSIANAVFLLAGGALTLSISVLLDGKAKGLITPQEAKMAASAWYWLLSSVLVFLFLKGKLILQSYMLQFHTQFVNKHLFKFNCAGWLIGIAGFVSFAIGFVQLVNVAVHIVSP